MKTIRLFWGITLIMLSPLMAVAQVVDCSWFPAPCPHETEIGNAQDYTQRQEDNKITAKELAMEGSLKNQFTNMLQKLAKQNHWQLYELNESYFDRPNSFIGYVQWEATPYEKRPPHAYDISFILVVDKDSLKAWRDWYTNDLINQSNQAVADMNADRNNEEKNKMLQAYMDSAQYYGQLSAKYMQDHQEQYMKDIQANNKKGLKEHDDKIAWYQKRSDAFIKKYQDAQNGNYASSTSSFDALKKAKILGAEKFANASIVLVHFAVNPAQQGFGLTDDNQKCIQPQKPLNVSGAFYAGMLRNPNPSGDHAYDVGEADYMFGQPSHVATVLLGGWLQKHDSYNYARASYTANPANTNLTGVKGTRCDLVQNIAIHIEGRPDHIKKVLNEIEMSSLQKLITTPLQPDISK